jgi:phenylacetate-CoA ligase
MSINFSIKDFAYPVSILRLRSSFEKSQWFSEDALRKYQMSRLKLILAHAYKNVPYYTNLFDRFKLRPSDFNNIEDLKKIPVISKNILRENFKSLIARNAVRFKPYLVQTSGTTGEPVKVYQDKNTNVLEFCYYWRYWSWSGYRLGMPFAEFTLSHFLSKGLRYINDYTSITKRLALNPIQLSYSNIDKFLLSISKYKPYFLKGSPSSIYTFAILLKEKKCCDISFRAIFTTGESLFPYQKKKIEEIFHCKIADSYGHMERTVAICQCPFGRYHINSDYGILEIDKDKNMPSLGIIAGNVIGTSLYNFTMPLIRYKVGDMIEMFADNKVRCECGRGLPVCNKLAGRGQDVIITPDGRMLSNIFILFDIIKGALWVQIVQQQADMLKVKLIKGDYFSSSSMEEFLKRLKEIVGTGFRVEIEYLSKNMLGTLLAQKYKPVVSI